ncbi:6533_t:CDS:2, partial [Ambispora gerdemannii]
MTTSQDHRKPLLGDHLKVPVPSYGYMNETASQISIRDLNTWDMMKLTMCMAGIQFTYLIALVWLAGPLSGLIVQPVIGAFSDKSTFKHGRRRPVMIFSGILVCLSLLGVAYSNELAAFFLSRRSYFLDNELKRASIWIAVISFYCLDFSLNAIMATCRALIVDISPLWQQEIGNAWAGRMIHIGNFVGYFTGFINLVSWLPWLGSSQMKGLCNIAIFMLIASLIITCLSVTEKVHVPINGDENTTWIVDIYSPKDDDELMTAVRYGSFCLLLYSIVSFVAGMILPQLTPNSYPTRNPFTIYNIYTVSHLIVAVLAFLTFAVSTISQAMLLIAVLGIPWAVAMWVPYALVGEFVSRNDQECVQDVNGTTAVMSNENSTASLDKPSDLEEQLSPSHTHHQDASIAKGKLPIVEVTASSNSQTYSGENNDEIVSLSATTASSEFDAGMILGVHNMYIVLPQFATAFISSVIFKIVKDMNDGDETGGVAWVIRFGGIMMIFAAILSR